RFECKQWIAVRYFFLAVWLTMPLYGEIPCERAYPRKQHDEAYDGPDDHLACQYVVYQIFIRPVIRISNIIAYAIGRRSPRGPEEETIHRLHTFGVAYRIVRDCVMLPKLGHLRIVTEQLAIM